MKKGAAYKEVWLKKTWFPVFFDFLSQPPAPVATENLFFENKAEKSSFFRAFRSKKFLMATPVMAALFLCLPGCGREELLEEKIGKGVVDRIVVTMAMGNPAYGAECKMITDDEEIEAFLAAFNEATIGKKVAEEDLWVAGSGRYALYSGEELLVEISCNGNDSERVWRGDGFRHVSYGEQPLPSALYEASAAEEIVVDINGNEMSRPAE